MWEREAHINCVHGEHLLRQTPYRNYLEAYRLCAGKHSEVNAIGKQLSYPLSSALTQWRFAVQINKSTLPRKSGGILRLSTRFSLSMEMSKPTRNGNWMLNPNREVKFSGANGDREILLFPVSGLATSPDWSLFLLYVMIIHHTYIKQWRCTHGSVTKRSSSSCYFRYFSYPAYCLATRKRYFTLQCGQFRCWSCEGIDKKDCEVVLHYLLYCKEVAFERHDIVTIQ